MPIIATAQDWIADLPEPVRAAIGKHAALVSLEPGVEITTAGKAAVSIHRIVDGHVKLTGLHEDGRRSFLGVYAPGACFSETAVVAERAYHHTTTTLTPTTIAVLKREDFWALYRAHPSIPETLCRKFAATISRQIRVREIRASHRLGKLVAMMFENLAERCAEIRTPNSCVIAVPLSQSEIGDHFDVTRQSIQREVTALKVAGILDKQAGKWIVRDLARLAVV